MYTCHKLMNDALEAHRTKTNEGIQYAIQKYHEALNNVPEDGTLIYPESEFSVQGGNHIRSEIWTHIGYAYHDLTDPINAKEAYDTALEYNPNNQDAGNDCRLPHGLRARYDNQTVSGAAAKYVDKGSLCRVIITENKDIQTQNYDHSN